MKRKINRSVVDPKGYKEENKKNFTDYKVIPSNNITMDGVKETVMAIMLDKSGQAKGFEFMEPGKDYVFPDTESVIEIPKYQMAGKINFRPDTGMPSNEVPVLGNINPAINPWADQEYRTTQNNLITEGAEDRLTNNITPEDSNAVLEQINTDQSPDFENPENFQFFNQYAGVDIPSAAVTLGSSIEEGNTMGIVGSALKLTAGLGRNIFSGAGIANRQKQVMKDYREKQRNYVTGANRPTYMAEGGKIEKALTGEYMFGMNDVNPMTVPNAEIETGEYIQHPDSEIQQAVGDTHEKGGMDVALEDGTRILSDHLKIGGEKSKYFEKKFDLELKAKDTFATVLDKFNRKSGLEKIVKEQEELITEIDKQQKETKDKESLGLNMQYLSSKMKDLEDKKKPLEEARKILFEEVYKAQEEAKPKDERDEEVYENGGQIDSLASKYGLSKERAQELIKEYQKGGKTDISRFYSPLDVNTGNFGRQPFTRGTTLSVEEQEAVRRLRMQQQSLPYLMKRSGVGTTTDFANVPDLLRDPNLLDENGNPVIVDATNNSDSINRFQVGYNNYLTKAKKAIESNPNISAEEKLALIDKISKEGFGDGLAKNYDGIYGDFTSSRSGVALPALNKRDREIYGDKIKLVGDVVNPDGTIKDEFSNLSPETQDYLKNLVKETGETGFDIGLLDIPTPAQPAAPSPSTEAPVNTETPVNVAQEEDYTQGLGMFLLPEQNPLPPTSLQPHLKVNRRFDRIDPALISTEQNLEEIRRQEASATENYVNLPDTLRVAALANLNANTQQNMNRTISETNKINSQITSNADMQNAQTQRMEENAAANDALSYEQRQLTALARTQNDFANYYNTLQSNNVRNFNAINNLNLTNAMYDDYQFTGNGVERVSEDPIFAMNNSVSKKEVDKKRTSKKKLGGRFKK